MTLLLSIIAFIVIFSLLILIHEFGHFYAARKCGIKVEEFGLGIPPKIWGFKPKKSETEYTLNAIPFGGFVRLYGEDKFDAKAEKSDRSYVSKPAWMKIIVVVAGVFMNFLLAWALLSIGYTVGMRPEYLTRQDFINGLEQEMVIVQDGYLIKSVSDEMAAKGIEAGDQIVKINDQEIINGNNYYEIKEGESFTATILTNGDLVEVETIKKNQGGDLELYELGYIPRLLIETSEEGFAAAKPIETVNERIVFDLNKVSQNNDFSSALTLKLENGEEIILPNGLEKAKTLKIVSVIKDSPAQKVGIQMGDEILKINNEPLNGIETIEKQISKPNQEIVYQINRDSEILDFKLTTDEQGTVGVILSDIWKTQNQTQDQNYVVYVNSVPTSVIEWKDLKLPFYQAPIKALQEMGRLSVFTVEMFGNLFTSVFTKLSVPEGVAGPVGIAQMTYSSVEQGLMPLLRFVALLSLSLAIINILPFPGLDGGRFFLILVPLILRRKLDAKLEGMIHVFGFFILMFLILLVTFNDISRIVMSMF